MGTPTCAYQQQQHAHHGQRRLGAREPDWQLCKHHPLRLDLRCEQLRLCTQGKQHPQRSLRGLRLGCPQHRREVVGPVGECSRISQTGLSVLGHGYAVLREIPSIPRKLWPPRPCCFLVEIYMKIGDPVLATGIMSFLLHELFYFGRCIPWMIIDSMPYFRKWKLQDTKAPTRAEQWKCTKYVLLTPFTVELPQIWGFHPLAEYFGMSPQILGFFLFEDFFHYWAHRALHWGPLYKKIHKLHHEFSAPFGLAAEYAHPLEILILGTGTIAGPLLWCLFSKGNLHIITMYVWIILPLWSGADHHDHHHQFFIGNYSTSFRIWDYVFGTEGSYRLTRQKQRDEKKAAKEALRLK